VSLNVSYASMERAVTTAIYLLRQHDEIAIALTWLATIIVVPKGRAALAAYMREQPVLLEERTLN
jgi:hypothetical protein